MQKTIAIAAALLLGVATFVGCSGKPSGFPKISSCEVNVTNGGEPIEGVEVALIPDETMSGVIVGGTTDATGKCVVKTTYANFQADGAPAGSFSIQLRKDPTPETPALTVEEMTDMERGEIDKYNAARQAEIDSMPKIIPPTLTSAQTSPIKATTPGDKKIDVDVSQYF